MDVLVTRKGQVTLPVALRRKYGIKQGMTVTIEDSPTGISLKVTPRFVDLIGIDAERFNVKKTLARLDQIRSEDVDTG